VFGYNKDKINSFPTVRIQISFSCPQKGKDSKSKEEISDGVNMGTYADFQLWLLLWLLQAGGIQTASFSRLLGPALLCSQ